jgi:ferredoxin
MRHTRSRSHTTTKYIELDRSRCQACWKCVESCPNGVLGKIIFFNHRHARVDHAEACKGCRKCLDTCPNGAIRYTYVPPAHRPRDDAAVTQEHPSHFISDNGRTQLP